MPLLSPKIDYLSLQNKTVTFEDFIKDPIIIREKGSGMQEMDLFLERIGITPSDLNVIARMNDLEGIKKSIVNGLGISILSARSAIDLQKTKQILLFPLEESAHKRTFYIVYSKNRILKPHEAVYPVHPEFLQDFLNHQHFLHASYPCESACDSVSCVALFGFIFPQSWML